MYSWRMPLWMHEMIYSPLLFLSFFHFGLSLLFCFYFFIFFYLLVSPLWSVEWVALAFWNRTGIDYSIIKKQDSNVGKISVSLRIGA